jgi:hypothetical protein
VKSDSEAEDHELPAADSVYHELPTIDPADKWCLKYVSVFYGSGLSEGFDGDANGLVSVREVNAFTSAIPLGWTLPKALAYWAAGKNCYRQVEPVLMSVKAGEWIANTIMNESNRSWTAWFIRKKMYFQKIGGVSPDT